MSIKIPLQIRAAKGIKIPKQKSKRDEFTLTPIEFSTQAYQKVKPPSWMKGDALEEWNRIMKIKEYRQILTSADQGLLVGYCLAYENVLRYAKKGYDLPATMLNSLITAASKLGMTPVDRSKINNPKKQKKAVGGNTDEAWDELMQEIVQ